MEPTTRPRACVGSFCLKGERQVAKTQRVIRWTCGRIVIVYSYPQVTALDDARTRAAKVRTSSPIKQAQNHRSSINRCEMLMATNFDRHDLFITLTYRDEKLPRTREEAVRFCSDFLRCLRLQRAARGIPTRYIKNVEHLRDDGTEGRWHHHIILNGTGHDAEEIRALWSKYGDNIEIEQLLDGYDYRARAAYLCKERPPLGKQCFTPSRGLRQPVRTSELVSDDFMLAPPVGARVIETEQVDNYFGRVQRLKYELPYKEQPKQKKERVRCRYEEPVIETGRGTVMRN